MTPEASGVAGVEFKSVETIKKLAENPFQLEAWCFVSDFTGALAKWLVKQSPYPVPANLTECIEQFHEIISNLYEWDKNGMCLIDIEKVTAKMEVVLWAIPEVARLNLPKVGERGHKFTSRFDPFNQSPDTDFIDIYALARNIACELRDAEHYNRLKEQRAAFFNTMMEDL